MFLLAAGTLLAARFVTAAQKAGKVYRIGWLTAGARPSESSAEFGAFRNGLKELRYVEGRDIAFEFRYAEGKEERLSALAEELVKLGVDVIVTVAAPVTRAAKAATGTIPIVMVQSGDPIAAGLVASYARPGGNVTGIVTLSAELIGKRMELLKSAFPDVSRIAVFARAGNPAAAAWLKDMDAAARSLAVQLLVLEVRGPGDFESAFQAAIRGRANAMMELPNPIFHQNRHRIADFAAKNRLPAMFHTYDFVEAGGLMSYGADYPFLYRRAALYVDRILKGTTPSELPVEQPTKFQLVINLKTAKALGFTIPQSVLLRADRVIE
jgi:putative ABC transport system substrate-binding protein